MNKICSIIPLAAGRGRTSGTKRLSCEVAKSEACKNEKMRPLNVCVNSDVRRMGMQSQVCEWDNNRTSKIQNIPTDDRLERETIISRWSPSRRRLEYREPVETVAAIAVYRLPRHHRSISRESRWWRCGNRQSPRGGSRRARSERRPINIHTGADRRGHHG